MLFFQISGEEERFLFLIGAIYESIVLAIALTLLVFIVLKYLKKRHRLTLYLMLIFVFYVLAVVFSLISKVSVVMRLDLQVDPNTPFGWIFFRILSFRVSEFFVCIAIYLTYVLKVRIFQEEFNKIEKYVVIIFGSFTAFYDLVIYQAEHSFTAVLLDAIAFLLTLIFMAMIYLVFMYRMLEAHKHVDQPIFRKAFLSLAIMAVCFIMIFVCFLIDRVLILLLEISGFTIFYYLAWAFTILGILCAYLGYIRPEAGELK
jgi:hypothetical protein